MPAATAPTTMAMTPAASTTRPAASTHSWKPTSPLPLRRLGTNPRGRRRPRESPPPLEGLSATSSASAPNVGVKEPPAGEGGPHGRRGGQPDAQYARCQRDRAAREEGGRAPRG